MGHGLQAHIVPQDPRFARSELALRACRIGASHSGPLRVCMYSLMHAEHESIYFYVTLALALHTTLLISFPLPFLLCSIISSETIAVVVVVVVDEGEWY